MYLIDAAIRGLCGVIVLAGLFLAIVWLLNVVGDWLEL